MQLSVERMIKVSADNVPQLRAHALSVLGHESCRVWPPGKDGTDPASWNREEAVYSEEGMYWEPVHSNERTNLG